MTNGPSPTPEQNAQNIADLTAAVAATNAAVNGLVSQFIRPNAQQANTNRETLSTVVEGLLNIEQRLDQMTTGLESLESIVAQNAQQQQANNQQIAAIGDRLEQYDQRLEETRAIVAENSSGIAQLSVKQDQLLDRIDEQQAETTETLNSLTETLNLLIEENRAFRESQQSQLAAIIGNGRRIDRLEQQAS